MHLRSFCFTAVGCKNIPWSNLDNLEAGSTKANLLEQCKFESCLEQQAV